MACRRRCPGFQQLPARAASFQHTVIYQLRDHKNCVVCSQFHVKRSWLLRRRLRWAQTFSATLNSCWRMLYSSKSFLFISTHCSLSGSVALTAHSSQRTCLFECYFSLSVAGNVVNKLYLTTHSVLGFVSGSEWIWDTIICHLTGIWITGNFKTALNADRT